VRGGPFDAALIWFDPPVRWRPAARHGMMTAPSVDRVPTAMPLTVAQIYRYPVKGLTPEPLSRVHLVPGEGLPHDRRFALAHGSTTFDITAPTWMPKSKFLMLMRNERLAKLRTRFDETTGVLTVQRDGKTVANGNILTPTGRAIIQDFFAAYMGGEARGAPKLLEAPGHMFSDVARKVVSIIGLASLRDLERVVRRPVDPRRFRANLYFENGRPWEEFEWVGRDVRIGPVRLRGIKPIERCAATNVDPETGERDLNIPLALQQGFQHEHAGIYAQVMDGGPIAIGDEIILV
jgi:uncharacterized protein YcbX